ncbi:hypothetical protein C0W35_06490 [Photobacterium kishitanii]|nr:hypothetical protein C0W35_06490 [Photobacterium kishitanii]CEO41639.1 putative Uncharacterized 25.9 kDa protein in CS5 3'region [Photobacterium kishitanii]
MNKFFILFLFISQQVFAISVDKMIVVSKGNNDSSIITVMNDDSYPVFVKAQLSELMPDGKSKLFDNHDFKQWPIYLNHTDFIIDPKSRVKITVNNLQEMLGNKENKDRIIGISFIPESYEKNNSSEKSLNILTGFKVWYIIPNNLKEVTGNVTYKKESAGKYDVFNNTDTVLTFNINACQAMNVELNNECSDTIMILSGKKKTINLNKVEQGTVVITAQDYRDRFKKKINIKI